MTTYAGMVSWILVAVAAFEAAYAFGTTSILIVLYLFALLQLARADRWRKAFYSGLVVGMLIAVMRLQFFWRIFSSAALALWLVYAFWIGLFVALARLCLIRLGTRWGWLLIPFVWTGLEYFRSELYYLRFAWLNAGYAFVGAPWQGALGLTGVYGLGFLLMGVAAGAASLWSSASLTREAFGVRRIPPLSTCQSAGMPRTPNASRIRLALMGRIGSMALLSLGVGGICLGGLWCDRGFSQGRAKVRVAGVQMEFPTEREVLVRLDDLIRSHPDTELVVLSEYTFGQPVPEAVREWCRKNRRYLIIGGKDPSPGGNFYNTAFVVGPGGELVFRQVKAVPIQFFKDGLPAAEQKVWPSPWGKIGICVCYDLSYTRVTDRLVGLGAEALIVPTMDLADWGRAQHELHARIAPARATEYGLPIFRVASSGISQLVNCGGRVLTAAPCPGDGAILAGTLELRGAGHCPLDRWIARCSVGITAMLTLWFSISQSRSQTARSVLSARSLLPLWRRSKAPASWAHSKRFARQVGGRIFGARGRSRSARGGGADSAFIHTAQ